MSFILPSPHLPAPPMERTLLRSISSRTFTRSSRRLSSSSSATRRLIPNSHSRSPLRHHLRNISTASPSRIDGFNTRLVPRAIATSSPQFSGRILIPAIRIYSFWLAVKKPAKKAKEAKDPNKPKRPASAFFVFMEDFRKQYKEKHPKNKSVSVVGKAGGAKWKSLSAAEKAPFVAKAEKRKAEYDKTLQAYNKKLTEKKDVEEEEEEESDKSKSGR